MANQSILGLIFLLFTSLSVQAYEQLPVVRESISTKKACQVILGQQISPAEWEALLTTNAGIAEINTLFETAKTTHPLFISKIDEDFLKQILFDPEMSFFHSRIKSYLSE